MRRLLAPLFVLAVLHAPPSRADGPEGIDGKPPDKILLDKRKAEFKVYVAHAGYEPLVHPDKEGRVKLKDPITFMQPFYVAAIHQPSEVEKKQTFFYLVNSKDGTVPGKYPEDHIGWVPFEYLVRGREAEVLPNGIVRKVLIVNRQGDLPKEEKLDEVRIRHAPKAKVDGKDEPFRLYTPMFVYGEADGYVLVGDAPAFSTSVSKKPSDVVMGWLPKARVEPWATREALEWDHDSTLEPADRRHRLPAKYRKDPLPRRDKPGKIYATKADAEKALEGEDVKGIFAETAFRKMEGFKYPISPKLDKKAPRFPLLELAAEAPGGNTLYKVGGIGGLAAADGTLLMDAGEVAIFRSIIDDRREQVKQTDILFVIDDSASMDRFYDAVARMVRKITDLSRSHARSVRVGALFFKDLPEKSAADTTSPNTFLPLVDVAESGEAMAKKIEAHKAKVGGGGDMHEMVYRGVIEGLAKAEPNPKARKVVIVIGDCGDITASERRRETDAWYMKKFTVDGIVKRLVPENLKEQTPWEFYAIRVPGVTSDSVPAETDFLEQMKDIDKRAKERHKERTKAWMGEGFDEKKYSAPGAVFDSGGDGEKKIQVVLSARYEKLLQDVTDAEEALVRLKRGQWSTALTPEMEQRLNDEIKAKGLKFTIEELRKRGGAQIFQTGYVWAKNADGLPQVRRLVMLSQKELEDLAKFLKDLNLDETKRADAIAAIIEAQAKANATDAVTKEYLEKLSLDTVRQQARGLAFRKGILNASYDALLKGRVALTQQEFFDLKYAQMLLEDVAARTTNDYTVKEIAEAGRIFNEYVRVPKTVRDDDRSFILGKESDKYNTFYFLDYAEEWP